MPDLRQSVRPAARPIRLPMRLYQCPGCFSYGPSSRPEGGWIECECGERMTLIDLRERRDQPLTEDAY
jgi:hypothetical protein